MSYYRVCPICGAFLDPGELCDCRGKKDPPSGAGTPGGRQENNYTSIIEEEGGIVNDGYSGQSVSFS